MLLLCVRLGDTVGEERHVAPVGEQRRVMKRSRPACQNADRTAADLVAVAIGTMRDAFAPMLGEAGHIRQRVAHAGRQHQPRRGELFAAFCGDREAAVDGAGAFRQVLDDADRGIFEQLPPRLGEDFQWRLAVIGEEAVRMGGEAVARLARVDDQHLAPRAGGLGGGRQAGETAADDDEIILHGCGFPSCDGG